MDVVPPLVIATGIVTNRLKAHAIAVVLAPEVVHWASFGLAVAHAFKVIEDFVVSANLGSADASALCIVVELVHSANVRGWVANAIIHVPVLFCLAWLRNALAFAVVSAPEFILGTGQFVADTLSDLEVPELGNWAILGVLCAQASAVCLNVPEVTSSAHLCVLLATA